LINGMSWRFRILIIPYCDAYLLDYCWKNKEFVNDWIKFVSQNDELYDRYGFYYFITCMRRCKTCSIFKMPLYVRQNKMALSKHLKFIHPFNVFCHALVIIIYQKSYYKNAHVDEYISRFVHKRYLCFRRLISRGT